MLDIAFKDTKVHKTRAIMCIIGVMACVLLIGVINIIIYEEQTGLAGDLGTVGSNLYFEQNGTNYPPAGSIISESLGDQVLNKNKKTNSIYSVITILFLMEL